MQWIMSIMNQTMILKYTSQEPALCSCPKQTMSFKENVLYTIQSFEFHEEYVQIIFAV